MHIIDMSHINSSFELRDMRRGLLSTPLQHFKVPFSDFDVCDYYHNMLYPPLTLSVCPVIKLAASEAKNRTAFAVSDAFPSLLRGIPFFTFSNTFGVNIF